MARTKNPSFPSTTDGSGRGGANAGRGPAEADNQGERKRAVPQELPSFYQNVTIDGRVYVVNYSTAAEFARLLQECATQAVTNIPRAVDPPRFYFQCIHCGDKTFSNKMRLNKHRFMSQCPAVRDETGNPMRMLPYPDQGRGQGKASEMMRRGKAVEVDAKVLRNQAVPHGTVPGKVRVEPTKMNCGEGAGKGMKRSTTTAPTLASVVSKGKTGLGQQCFGRGEETSGAQQVGEVGQEGQVGQKTSTVPAQTPQKRKSVRFREDTPAASRHGKALHVPDEEHGDDEFQSLPRLKKKKTGPVEPPPPRVARTRPARPQVQAMDGAAGLGAAKEGQVRKRKPCDTNAAEGELGPSRKGKASKSGSDSSSRRRTVQVVLSDDSDEEESEEDERPSGDVGTPESDDEGDSASGAEEQREMSPDTAFETVIEEALAEEERVSDPEGGSGLPDIHVAHSAPLSPEPLETRAPPVTSEPPQAPHVTPLRMREPPTVVPMDSHAPPAAQPHRREPLVKQSKGCAENASSQPHQGTAAGQPQSRQTKVTPDKHLAIVVWTGGFDWNHALHRYWLLGTGAPTPDAYHPGLASSLSARRNRLDEAELRAKMVAEGKAKKLAEESTPPTPPTPCEVPGMYHLVQIWPQLLDWTMDGQNEAEFMARFTQSWNAGTFQAATRECVVWWTCEAKEEDYATVFDLVGAAVQSICHSVKYKVVPVDIGYLGKYLQYVRDIADYHTECEKFAEKLKAEQERIVVEAVAKFRFQARFKREACQWDWCPIWLVLVEEKSIIQQLPVLPWRHDEEEALAVQRIILKKPLYRVKPPPLVQVLRIALHNIYGRWRQMSCPMSGLNPAVVRTLCQRERDIIIASSTFITEAHYRYSGMVGFQAHLVQKSVLKDAQLVASGKGDSIANIVLLWIQSVRFRALQDLARDYPTAFVRCWTTTLPHCWGEQGTLWNKCLRTRESFDLGLLVDEAAPKWASKLKAARAKITELLNSMEEASTADELAAWDQYEPQPALCPLPLDGNKVEAVQAREVTGPDSVAKHCVAIVDNSQTVRSPRIDTRDVNDSITETLVTLPADSESTEILLKIEATQKGSEDLFRPESSEMANNTSNEMGVDGLGCEEQRGVGSEALQRQFQVELAEHSLGYQPATEPLDEVPPTFTGPRAISADEHETTAQIHQTTDSPHSETVAAKGDSVLDVPLPTPFHDGNRKDMVEEILAPLEVQSELQLAVEPPRNETVKDAVLEDAGSEPAAHQPSAMQSPETVEGLPTSGGLPLDMSKAAGVSNVETLTALPKTDSTGRLESQSLLSSNSVVLCDASVVEPSNAGYVLPVPVAACVAPMMPPLPEMATTSTDDPYTLPDVPDWKHVADISTQDLLLTGLSVPITPSPMVGIVRSVSEMKDDSFRVVHATARNLVSDFAGEGKPVEDNVSDDEADSDRPNEQVTNVSTDPDSARRLSNPKSVTFPYPLLAERSDLKRSRLSILKTYEFYKIEELISALPWKGSGQEDAGTVNFFGTAWESLPVPLGQLRELQSARKMLGQNVVELLCRRLWWSLAPQARQRVHIAPSFMQGPLGPAWDSQSEEALLLWGRRYLVPARLFRTCPEDFEVLVPYVDSLHWSLLVFTSTGVLHLDSAEQHVNPTDMEYVNRVWKVWQLLRFKALSPPPSIEKVPVFQQRGNYECGFFVLRFIELYIRYIHGDDPHLDHNMAAEIFRAELLAPVTPAVMQKNVIAAVADELGFGAISELYEPPFRAMYDDNESSVETVSPGQKPSDDGAQSNPL